jgi:hypothetical protein
MCGLLAESTEARHVACEQKVERQVFTRRRNRSKASGVGAEGRKANVDKQKLQRQGEWFRSRR